MPRHYEIQQIISILMKEAHYSIKHGHHEDAVLKLQKCLQLEDEPKGRLPILDDLGYCFLKLGWFEDAVNAYTEYFKILPLDNDGRFFLASAYTSSGWKCDAIINNT
jgi:tetratricopeptide (TPR) repeat protein